MGGAVLLTPRQWRFIRKMLIQNSHRFGVPLRMKLQAHPSRPGAVHLLFALHAAGQQLRIRWQVDGVFVPLQHLQRLAIDKSHGRPSGFHSVHPPHIPAQTQCQ